MVRIHTGRVRASACLALALASSAWADPITVSGSIGLSYGRGSFRAFGFSLEGDQQTLRGFQPDGPSQSSFGPACTEFAPCTAGATTSPTGTIGVLAIGSAVIDGTSYDLTQNFGGPLNTFRFTAGEVVIPEGTSDMFSLQTPFTFSGLLDVFAMDSSSQWTHVRDFSLIGHGTATMNFQRYGEGYAIKSIRYELANPTPEPASLLLLGIGLAMVARRRMMAGRAQKAV